MKHVDVLLARATLFTLSSQALREWNLDEAQSLQAGIKVTGLQRKRK